MLTRRGFLKHSLGAAGLLLIGPQLRQPSPAEPESLREAALARLLFNHAGFAPHRAKYCLQGGRTPTPFTVVETGSGQIVHQGVLEPFTGDLGEYVAGNFSSVSQTGTFHLEAAGRRGGSFVIDPQVYTPAVRQCIEYFARQRCGDSRTGHHAPCHLDDGLRRDNLQRQDVTGGWHDACDLRKWVEATIYGMVGLSRVLDLLGPRLSAEAVVEELRWGNQYFRKMQEPAGYLMSYCGGDDGNRYTDNRIGSSDDRRIHVEPCDLPGQFFFVAAQADMIRHTRQSDAAYARECEESASRCLGWCVQERDPQAATSLGAGVIACARLHRATGSDRCPKLAAGYLQRLLSLQVDNASEPAAPRGFFRAAADRPEPVREIQHGNLPLLALCEALEQFPDHAEVPRWREGLRRHADYLLAMSSRSAFGTIPFGLYVAADPGGNRRLGPYWYRWFMKPRGEYSTPDWWVGINAHLASHGIGLSRASRLLQDPRLAEVAQRQLDWILGANPCNASTVTGVGRNQPPLFVTGEFTPATPLIAGGVMNGLGGSADDAVVLDPGSYHTCEYWTPMVAYTMWLMAELQAA